MKKKWSDCLKKPRKHKGKSKQYYLQERRNEWSSHLKIRSQENNTPTVEVAQAWLLQQRHICIKIKKKIRTTSSLQIQNKKWIIDKINIKQIKILSIIMTQMQCLTNTI